MEDKIYKPEELLFFVDKGDEDGGMFDVVALTPEKYWKEEKCMSDDIGGHNVPGDILEECGVCSVELQESIFEILEGFTVEEVRKNLLSKGFKEDEEFSKFLTR